MLELFNSLRRKSRLRFVFCDPNIMVKCSASLSFVPPVFIARSYRFFALEIDGLISASEAQVEQESSSLRLSFVVGEPSLGKYSFQKVATCFAQCFGSRRAFPIAHIHPHGGWNLQMQSPMLQTIDRSFFLFIPLCTFHYPVECSGQPYSKYLHGSLAVHAQFARRSAFVRTQGADVGLYDAG